MAPTVAYHLLDQGLVSAGQEVQPLVHQDLLRQQLSVAKLQLRAEGQSPVFCFLYPANHLRVCCGSVQNQAVKSQKRDEKGPPAQ